MDVRELTDRKALRAFLEQDRSYAAYALGDLEPYLFQHCGWYVAEVQGVPRALALLFTGMEPHALFLMGEGEGLETTLDRAPLPHRAYITCRPHDLDRVKRVYELSSPDRMWRMILRPEAFRPVQGDMMRLGAEARDELMELYREGEGTFFFRPYQLERGVYFGVRVDGKLVAAAGTHLVAPSVSVACVGNVFTRADHRRRGYGAATTSSVIAELLSLGLTVALNVRQDNTSAIRLYECLGFRRYCAFVEGMGVRR